MQGIDFSRIRVHDGSQHKGFEDLVCQLANRSKPKNAREFIPKDGAGGDAGVECYWKFIDGSEHAWQAKYFLDPLKTTQWKQISKSVETALNKHPKLTKYYVCLPRNRTDARRVNRNGQPILSEKDWWDHYVKKWTAIAAKKSMTVEFVYWGKLQITSLILQSKTSDLANITQYWFGAADGTTDVWSHRRFPTDIVDREIKKSTDVLRKTRFFPEFDRVQSSLTLAKKLVDGNLSGGTDEVRSHALAWCARILFVENPSKAEDILKYAKEIGPCLESRIAEAYLLLSKENNRNAALNALAGIDSPMARSAALMIVAHGEGKDNAIQWLKRTGIDSANLDPDGKRALLAYQLNTGDWTAAHESLDLLTDDDLREAPVLHHLVAITHLLTTVPEEIRSAVLVNLPFDTRDFPFDSSEQAIEVRRIARRHFVIAHEVADQLNLPHAAAIAEEYALWLELSDPDESDNGRKRLSTKLRDLKTGLRFVRFGVQSGIKLDLEAIEREIKQQTAMNGKITHDAAFARFALVFTRKTPQDVASYIAQYKNELVAHLDSKFVMSIQIEALSKAGQLERANEVLDLLIQEGIPEPELNRHRQMISEATGGDPVEGQKELFARTDALRDLANLVDDLEAGKSWDDLCVYGAIKFERTKALPDAERYALALYNTQMNEQLMEFLESNSSLLSQSRQLQLLSCWTLFYEGRLLEASSKIEELSDWWDNPDCRELRVNIGIFLGDWDSLSSVVAHECENKNDRSAEALIRTAQLAFHLGLPQSQVKELMFAAVERANDNAGVLANAYFLASSAGWENVEEVSNWLQRAVALSGDDGPIGKATFQEIAEQKPLWDQIQSDVWMKLRRGELPMYRAGQVLNRSLIHLMLYPFFVNLTETDPRRRSTVFAYSGGKRCALLDPGENIAMDVSALLTLSSLDLLDKSLDAFEDIHISHSTLGWFFVERKKAVFHQPSRISEAHEIRRMLAEGAMEKLTRDEARHNELTDQVGHELAQLITEAETAENEDGLQRIVVCPGPVHRAGSLMDEEADLTEHGKVLSSCASVVEELRRKGRITEREERRARAYLRLHEKPWPEQPAIADGATLYLTNLATTYFQHLGLLEKLKGAGFRPVVSPSVVSEVHQLISYGNTSVKIQKAIERIRSALRTGLANGKVKTDRRVSIDKPITPSDEPTEQSIPDHPTLGVISLAKQYDAIVIDDRYISQQYPHITAESTVTPVFSSLDVIDALVAADSITNEERIEYRMKLRNAGYILVPVDVDELIHYLDDASVDNSELRDTAELKAIRENLLLVRLSGCNLSVEEDDWLRMLFKTFREAIKELWKRGGDLTDIQVRSDWILRQLDLRIWAHCFERETGKHMVGHGYGAHIMSLLLLPIEELQDVKEDYWRWIEDKVLDPIKEQSPELYLELVEWYRRHIASMVDKYATESVGNEK